MPAVAQLPLEHMLANRSRLAIAALTWLLATAAIGQRAADVPIGKEEAVDGDTEWVRCHKSAEDRPVALQTAIGHYEGTPAGTTQSVSIDLVGAIHVGDRTYYRDLDARFAQYDAVLYELVAPEGTVVPRGGRVDKRNALGAMQSGMQNLLDLQHQLEEVDYTPNNFVHADMSPAELFATMKQRDEGFLKLYFRMVGQGIAEQTKSAKSGNSVELDLMTAFFAKDRPRQMKIAFASQLTQLDGLLTSFGGEKGSTLIHERNRVAMDVLAEQIAAGKRKLAIFYGAGHLADMDERLRSRFGVRQTSKEWVTAWDLSE